MSAILFEIHYLVSAPDEQLYWQSAALDAQPQEMEQVRSGVWQYTLALTKSDGSTIEYNYQVQKEGTIHRVEPPLAHSLSLSFSSSTHELVVVHDRWIVPNPLHRLARAPLASILGYPDLSEMPTPLLSDESGTKHLLLFEYAQLYEGELFITGSTADLGEWQEERAVPLTWSKSGWLLGLAESQPLEFKLLLKSPDGTIYWEEGKNRVWSGATEGACTVTTLPAPSFPVEPIRPRQLEGTAVPLFSLRTDQSFGIGDFSDAIRLLEWMERKGQSILQFLPLYDTTFTRTERDSYPYNSVTTYGLHPVYIDVRKLPYYHESPRSFEWEERARALNREPAVQYEEVLRLKEEVMDECYERWSRQKTATPDFDLFCRQEGDQLLAYSLFAAFRDLNPGVPVVEFPSYDTLVERYKSNKGFAKKVRKHSFRQYYLYQQLGELSREAHARGILLKGDLPIGVGQNSADVWCSPHLFHLDMIAGAPPDAFSATGQVWGFPTYNWEEMRAEGYSWWRRRLSRMASYIDAIRIDHILGFFRIWSIPRSSGKAIDGHYVPAEGFSPDLVKGVEACFVADAKGLYHPLLLPEAQEDFHRLTREEQEHVYRLRDDYYYHRNESLWRATALQRLTHVMRASDMLICAEDLGILPSSIHEVLADLELLSLEVVRMPKQAGNRYVPPAEIPLLSVLCTSTHDMPTLRSWWQTLSDDERQTLAHTYGIEEGSESPQKLIEALRCTASLLLILPLQDWFVMSGYGAEVAPHDEQINVPQDPDHVWNYRMPGTIDHLIAFDTNR
ncbi:MAG: 4-alpha-glucanotransferase [Porphyromonas sp.]|nr:4-alpha-glucanotransferase [Porphyromonas sp.]